MKEKYFVYEKDLESTKDNKIFLGFFYSGFKATCIVTKLIFFELFYILGTSAEFCMVSIKDFMFSTLHCY